MTPCRLVSSYRRFDGVLCLHPPSLIVHSTDPEEKCSKLLRNVGNYLRIDTASYATRLGCSRFIFVFPVCGKTDLDTWFSVTTSWDNLRLRKGTASNMEIVADSRRGVVLQLRSWARCSQLFIAKTLWCTETLKKAPELWFFGTTQAVEKIHDIYMHGQGWSGLG